MKRANLIHWLGNITCGSLGKIHRVPTRSGNAAIQDTQPDIAARLSKVDATAVVASIRGSRCLVDCLPSTIRQFFDLR